MAGIATLAEVAAWAQVPPDALASFHQAFGSTDATGLRAAATEPEADFAALVDSLLDPHGAVLTRLGRSSLKLFGRALRLATGTELTRT